MKLNEDQIEILRQKVNSVLGKIYELDHTLIQSGGQERSLSFRFGLYFNQEIKSIEWLNTLDIDLEYNKNGMEPKRIPRRPNGVVPDFIFHQRGNNENNVLVIEFKGWWSNDSRENDVIKLEDFVHQEGEYKYGLGFFIELNKNGAELTEFKDY